MALQPRGKFGFCESPCRQVQNDEKHLFLRSVEFDSVEIEKRESDDQRRPPVSVNEGTIAVTPVYPEQARKG
ncbi:MAG: hypothetical protein WBG54_05690 [Acidobacteriaceae bacterium]